MYNPASFRETRAEVIEAAISEYPLATLVTCVDGCLTTSYAPLLYSRTPDNLRVLRGHIARAKPQWQAASPITDVLAIFHGPQHYISPAWYPSTKDHGRVVPTWNYVVVEARGTLRFTDDPQWLLENVSALTDHLEASIPEPWRVSDAPPDFIEGMLQSIVGVELTITALEGKWKVSQNRTLPDRLGVIEGLHSLGSPESRKMAELVKLYLPH